MVILRQKAFNRAEKEALKQIYRKTGGLRNLPNGVTNLEDAKALKDLAIQLMFIPLILLSVGKYLSINFILFFIGARDKFIRLINI